MKPYFFVGILLVPLFLLTGVAVSDETRREEPGFQQEALTGYIMTEWSDYRSGSNEQSVPTYILAEDDSRSIRLIFDKTATQNLDTINLSPDQRVTVVGQWSQPLALDSSLRSFRVKTIRPVFGLDFHDSIQLPPPVIGAQPWITILCKFAGVPDEPQSVAYYQGLFSTPNAHLDRYWRELSFGMISLSGSNVVGWYTLPQPRSYYVYDMDGDGIKETDERRLSDDCSGVADSDVYFPSYVGINFIVNGGLTAAGFGGATDLIRDGVHRIWRMTWLAADQDSSFVESLDAHEMGHGFGLPHSSTIYEGTYDNPWDVMSADDGLHCVADPLYGCPGQHTIAYHKDLLGWIARSRKYVATWGSMAAITLERMEFPASSNYLMAKIPIGGSGTRFYTLEARQTVGYDNYMLGNAVVIHEVDTQRYQFPAELLDSDNNHNTYDAGTMWTPGEVFTDNVNGVTVCINSATETGFKVTVGLGVTVNCLFVPDLSETRLWSTPELPTTGQEVVFTTRLYNGGVAGQNVTASSTIPLSMTYVTGSASTTQGSVSGSNPVVFNVGTLGYDSVVTLTFAAIIDGSVLMPTALAGPVQISWQGGSLSLSHVVIANGLPVYLPLISR